MAKLFTEARWLQGDGERRLCATVEGIAEFNSSVGHCCGEPNRARTQFADILNRSNKHQYY